MHSSADGLSLLFVVFVALGNFTYILNILVFSVERVYLIRSLPWIVGSVVPLFFDIVVSIIIEIALVLEVGSSSDQKLLLIGLAQAHITRKVGYSLCTKYPLIAFIFSQPICYSSV